MGSVLSRVKLIVGALFLLNKTFDKLSKRLKSSPGLPVPNPTLPFWTVPKSKISSDGKELPVHADIVIIGSGITGASVAYYLLSKNSALKIVILEARDVCSGATGRNGGHINPPLYSDWVASKKKHGEEQAKALMRFRLAHTPELQAIAGKEDLLKESQVRTTEHLEVYYTEKTFGEAQAELAAWKADMPDEADTFTAYDGKEAIEKFQLSEHTIGCVWGPGGAIHPYRFVTNLYAKLLDRHTENFFIATNTPCTSITEPTPSSPFYTVTTPKGTITAPHIVHATNGWVSHLLEPMREKVVPVRGTMSSQRPGTSLGSVTLNGQRSYVFHPGGLGYDYLTQLPTGEHELMFGGGWASAFDTAWTDFGFSDDSAFSISVASHLAGALPLYFGSKSWGKEKEPVRGDESREGVEWGQGRTKAQWSGILGISADGLPWVGRLPEKISGRKQPPPTSAPTCDQKELEKREDGEVVTGSPGEWISAGYSGEGMVHAWMSGKALAHMVLDKDAEIKPWFPEILRTTEERWKKANIEDLLTRRLSS
ncbi:FAD dependent oxidoreductase [Irpex rosettiformis]|uniref:FAD dependent oxidoreductase n=1 Tax=Irpex rosettiformis TaxID=378272 RepID=A0ACB8U6P1_9APHY|nr:FAD dependent oxidoreductase [Irpex rosettiformis]